MEITDTTGIMTEMTTDISSIIPEPMAITEIMIEMTDIKGIMTGTTGLIAGVKVIAIKNDDRNRKGSNGGTRNRSGNGGKNRSSGKK